MSRRPKSSLSVALFPFLAVLVCTMGSLIFLLLVTTRMIRDRVADGPVASAAPAAPLPLLNLPVPEPAAPILAPPVEPAEPEVDEHALALQQRQRDLDALADDWRLRRDRLAAARDEHARGLAQREQQKQAAARRVAALQAELKELETQLGKLTGELSASAVDAGSIQERIELEARIQELKRRLRAAQQSPSNEDAVEIVPFDVISGTTRRPILIECTNTGLRFIPEDITIRPDDLTGFTPQVNPLIVGASALVNYWSAWNFRQPEPSREPQPYVLLLVRPSGTISYYVAMKMLADLKQPHGYELIEEDAVLQPPPVDGGAKAACETAVNRLLSERNHILRQAGVGGFGPGRGEGGGRKPAAPAGAGNVAATSPRSKPAGEPSEFALDDLVARDDPGGRSWERVENFEGPRRGGTAPSGATGRPGTGRSPVVVTPAGEEERASEEGGTEVDVGLGSSGNRSIPVHDQRTRKRKHSDKDIPAEPEHLVNRHWGISEPGAVIGLERELRIDVESGRYVMGGKQVVRIADGETKEQTFAKVVAALDQQACDWGKPPKGFFWKPNLRYVIADGGDANYTRIHPLLERAGLSSSREYANEPGEAAKPEKSVEPAREPATAPASPKPPRRFLRGILR